MKYTLIIPAWNEAAYLPDTLARVDEAMAGCSFDGHLIVVDNNSTDDTAAIAAASGAEVVFEPINQIARARNRGAEAADTDALVFLDADTILTAGLLQKGLDAIASGNIVGGGVTVSLDEVPKVSATWVLTLWNTVSKRMKLAAGSFIYCRRDAFEAVGGFDVKTYAGEELVLSRRLKRWGRKNAMGFQVITDEAIVTSSRKLKWYSSRQLFGQFLMMLIPGALYSKRLCRTWYDTETARD